MKFFQTLIRRLLLILLLSALAFIYIGLQGEALAMPPSPSLLTQVAIAQTRLADPTGTTDISGLVSITDLSDGVKIEATLQNAPPGIHGFHIHANGSCADAGNAAGGHFNPDGVKHGKLITDGFENAHAGDLGNILIYADGTGSLRETVPGLSLTEGTYGVMNHAVILHENRDDFSQPTGNAGGRIACGVLETSP